LQSLQVNGVDWFQKYPSNWLGTSATTAALGDFIDSELYFHYLMLYIIEANENGLDLVEGLYNAVNEDSFLYHINPDSLCNVQDSLRNTTDAYSANFILSDGKNIYAFRNDNDDNHSLGIHENDSFVGIRTYGKTGAGAYGNDYELDKYELVVITPYGNPHGFATNYNPTRITNFILPNDNYQPLVFIQGTITQNFDHSVENENEPRVWITGDVAINTNISVVSGTEVGVLDHVNIEIDDATLTICNNAALHLNHSSEVIIDGTNSELFLDWGSTITGGTPITYEATPPGYPSGAEAAIPGDRIIAQNGGIITTSDNYINPGNTIYISSTSDNQWDGIFIQTPADSTYWFVNCDISGIRKLSIENISESQNIANLNLYQSDFHNAGQIIARDGHILSIIGEDDTNRCNIDNNHSAPIVVYDSPVYIDWSSIEDNGYDEDTNELLSSYCDGMSLSYTTGSGSYITNTIVQGNTGYGIRMYGQEVDIENNTISNNKKHGLYSGIGTFEELSDNTIQNNLYAEYVSVQNSYNWSGNDNTIGDDAINASYYYDQYILMAYQWDEVNNSIDVTGNPISYADTTRFYPYFIAFEFDEGETPPEKEMLITALDEMESEDYESADLIFQQIISDYPESYEAATAVRGLLLIENYTLKDYAGLRSFIDNINIDEETFLYKAKEDVKTKSFMKDKEYETAIERLEIVINTSPDQDEVILAMIDEGYCYMELAESGERSLPADCTVQTKTFKEYQAMVRELESQFSFFPEEENQNITTAAGSILSLTNFPNPFNPVTTISFDLASESKVSVSVYNLKGQKVKQLVNDQLSAGQHTIEWNGTDGNNKSVASGIYFYKISTGNDTDMRKMLLLK